MPEMRRFRQAKRTAARLIDGAAFVVAIDHQSLLELNEVGTFIWEKLAEPRGVESLTRDVLVEFDVGADAARRDVEAFLGQLLERGAVVEEEPAQ